jgi:hypothetical protein
LALTRYFAKLSISPESSDGFASVGTILPKEEATLLPGSLFAFSGYDCWVMAERKNNRSGKGAKNFQLEFYSRVLGCRCREYPEGREGSPQEMLDVGNNADRVAGDDCSLLPGDLDMAGLSGG